MLSNKIISIARKTGLDKILRKRLRKKVKQFYDGIVVRKFEKKPLPEELLHRLPYYSIDTPPQFWEETYTINSEGIPLIEINGEKNIYNPVTIIQYGLSCYNEYLKTGNKDWKSKMMIQVEYIMNEDPHLYYHFDLPNYQLEKPWVSCLAYGVAISLLIRAWTTEKNDRYINKINDFYTLLILPVEQGGVLRKTPENFLWLEEYPNEKGSYVYNGFVTSVVGLLEMNLLIPDPKISDDTVNELLISVILCAKYYDVGVWFRYDRVNKKIINEFYMEYHVCQFEHLFRLTEDNNYLLMKKRFEKMCNRKYVLPYLNAYIYS